MMLVARVVGTERRQGHVYFVIEVTPGVCQPAGFVVLRVLHITMIRTFAKLLSLPSEKRNAGA